jgi:hypothetical protein
MDKNKIPEKYSELKVEIPLKEEKKIQVQELNSKELPEYEEIISYKSPSVIRSVFKLVDEKQSEPKPEEHEPAPATEPEEHKPEEHEPEEHKPEEHEPAPATEPEEAEPEHFEPEEYEPAPATEPEEYKPEEAEPEEAEPEHFEPEEYEPAPATEPEEAEPEHPELEESEPEEPEPNKLPPAPPSTPTFLENKLSNEGTSYETSSIMPQTKTLEQKIKKRKIYLNTIILLLFIIAFTNIINTFSLISN